MIAVLLRAAAPPRALRGRQIDLLRQLVVGQPAILLQQAEQFAIKIIQMHGMIPFSF
jgi:hypothetical protein